MKAVLIVLGLMAAQETPDPDAGTKMPTRQELQQPSRCALWADAEAVPMNTPVVPGRAYILTLPKVKARFAGNMPLTVEKGGVYSFALDGAATVDIVQGKDVVETLTNTDADVCGNGTAFTLAPGQYSVRIRNAARAGFKLAVIAK